MGYLPLTEEEEKTAVSELGLSSVDDLFRSIPPQLRSSAHFEFSLEGLSLDAQRNGLTEHELRRLFLGWAKQNATEPDWRLFSVAEYMTTSYPHLFHNSHSAANGLHATLPINQR